MVIDAAADGANAKIIKKVAFSTLHDTLADASKEIVYNQNGFTYEVTFESGCTRDEDCQANGISIRGGVDLGLSDSSAVCHPSGVCVCSNKATYYGPGCTKDGRGSPKRSLVVANSGDVPELEFDCSGLSASRLLGSGDVLVASPNKVTVVQSRHAIADAGNSITVGQLANGLHTGLLSAGDEVSINGQKRNVIYVDVSNNYFLVDEAFTTSSISEGANLANDAPVFILKHSTVTCGSTDQPQIVTDEIAANIANVKNGGLFSFANSAPKTLTADATSKIRDGSAINIGDRVLVKVSTTDNQIRTVDGFTGSGDAITALSIGEKLTNCAGTTRGDLPNVKVYKVSKGTTEAIECSRRGLCNEDTGICECFNGYTSYNCDRQNALAM